MSPPVLETPRLILRAHAAADLAECAAMWGDPLVTRFIGGRPLAGEEVWARLLRYGGLWSLVGFGYWTVRARDSARWVGEVGLADFRREMVPDLGDTPEVGWVLASWAHGRGFATEAVRAVLAWADAQRTPAPLASGRTVCLIAPENAASAHVAAKCGYLPIGDATYRGQTTRVFERRRPSEGRE